MATDNTSTDPSGYVQPEVDVRALTQVLDGDYAEIRDLVRTNLVTYASVLEEAEELGVDAFRERVRELVVEMAATGQTGMGFPAAYGGGGDVGASIAAFETLAFGDLSVLVKVGVQFGLFGGAILHLGTERHHDAYLPDLITGKLMGCFAMTETGHGSNVQALGTHARYDAAAQEFVITTDGDQARKDYIGNAARHAELAVVFAQLEVGGKSEGVHAFVVPVRTGGEVAPGVRIEDDGRKMGLNGVDNGRIWFDGVRVPREALLNRFADVTAEGVYESPIDNPDRRFFTMLGTLVQGRVSVGGAGVNAAKVALTIATKYAVRRRRSSRRPRTPRSNCSSTTDCISAVCCRSSRARTHCTSRRTWCARSCTRSSPASRTTSRHGAGWSHGPPGPRRSGPGTRPGSFRSAARRAAAPGTSPSTGSPPSRPTVTSSPPSRATTTSCSSSWPRACSPITRASSRTWTSSAWSATSPASRSRRSSRRPRPTSCSNGYVTCCPAATSGTRKRACSTRSTSSPCSATARSTCSRAWPAGFKRGIDQKRNPGVVFSQVQDHVIAVAHAHVERLVLEAFVDQVRALPEGGNKVALGLLCDLFALSTIEADRAWFMEHGRLTVQRSKAISREVNDLCRKVRPLAVDLVDAWGVPAEMLRAPDLLG